MTEPTPPTIEQEFAIVTQALMQMQLALQAHGSCDLTGLDEFIAKLCERLANLPAAERPQWEQPMRDLITILNALEEEIQRQQQQIKAPGAVAAYQAATKGRP